MEHAGAIIPVFDYLGTFAFAVSGALKAARKDMDLFGLMVIATITAIGGGTVRDVLLPNTPLFWLGNDIYLLLCLLATLVVFILYRVVAGGEKLLLVFDAIGLAAFTVIGTTKAMNAGVPGLAAILMGCLTGIGGGVMRDVLAGDVPLVLRREIYASASILGAFTLWALRTAGADEGLAIGACGLCVVTIRLLSIRYGWALPRVAWARETSPADEGTSDVPEDGG